jgi:hypothetical protein
MDRAAGSHMRTTHGWSFPLTRRTLRALFLGGMLLACCVQILGGCAGF